jgi:hypothetical protein
MDNAQPEVYPRELVPRLRGIERRERVALKATGGVAPKRPPFWLEHGDVGDHLWAIAPGWYWQAPDADFPSYLGHNSVRAEIALEKMIEQRRAQGAA